MSLTTDPAPAVQPWPRIGPSRTRPARRGIHPICGSHPRLFGPREELLARLDAVPGLRQRLQAQAAVPASSPPGFGELRTLALSCFLTGDAAAQDCLTREALAAAQADPTAQSTENLVRLIEAAAMGFDLLSGRWGQPQRQAVLSGLRRLVSVLDPTDGPHWHGPLSHLHLQRLSAIGLAGYVTYPENPLADQWIQRARDFEYESVLVPALVEWLANGGWAEPNGQELLGIGHLCDWMEVAQRVEGYDAIAAVPDWYRAHMLHLLFAYPAARRPAEEQVEQIDALRRAIGVLLDYYEVLSDPIAGALAEGFPAGLAGDAGSAGIVLLAHRQRSLVGCVNELAKSHVEPFLGHAYIRADWQADALWLRVHCGPHLISDQPLANGSFELIAGEELTLGGESILLLVGGEASNGGQSATWGVDGALRERAVAVEELPASHDVGRLVGFQDEGHFVYLAGQYEGAYQPSRARRVFRQWVLLRPDVLVIFDRAECTPAVTAARWQMDVRGALEQLSGTDWSISGERSRLLVRTLLPTNHVWQSEAFGDDVHRILIEPDEHSSKVMFLHVLTTDRALPDTRVQTGDDSVELQIGADRLTFVVRGPIGGRAQVAGRQYELEYREPNEIYGFEGPSII
jgi:hypothetical protein